jgi:hypothetical protein
MSSHVAVYVILSPFFQTAVARSRLLSLSRNISMIRSLRSQLGYCERLIIFAHLHVDNRPHICALAKHSNCWIVMQCCAIVDLCRKGCSRFYSLLTYASKAKCYLNLRFLSSHARRGQQRLLSMHEVNGFLEGIQYRSIASHQSSSFARCMLYGGSGELLA